MAMLNFLKNKLVACISIQEVKIVEVQKLQDCHYATQKIYMRLFIINYCNFNLLQI